MTQYTPASGFPVIEPEDAEPEITELYARVQQETDLPEVPNWAKVTAASPASLNIYMAVYEAYKSKITLPQTIVPIILYTIASARNCTYCSTTNELYCRTLGVDEETLELLVNDLDSVSPARLQVIIRFAVKCAFNAQDLIEADFESLRDFGISDDEIIQIIFLAALANFNDTLADSMKIEVEHNVLEALDNLQS